MKRILTPLIASMFFIGCDDNKITNYNCTKGTIKILKKESWGTVGSRGGWGFNFYLFDGKEAYTCNTDEKTWNSYNINDTLSTLVITKIIIFKK